MGEFLRFGRQNVYNTHETEIAEISRLGSEEDLKFSPFTKSINLGLFCICPSHIATKDTKLDSYKKQKREDLGVQQVGFQDPSCRSGAEARSIIHPTKNLWTSTTHQLSAPQWPCKVSHEHSTASIGTTWGRCPHLLATFTCVHANSSPSLSFTFLITSAYWIAQLILFSWINPWHFSHFLAFSSSSFSPSRHPQMIPQHSLTPKDPITSSLMGPTKPVYKGTTILEQWEWVPGKGKRKEGGRGKLCRP